MPRRPHAAACGLLLALASGAAAAPPDGATFPFGLLLAISELDGTVTPSQPRSNLTALTFERGAWVARRLHDPESNVFHQALFLARGREAPLVLTLGGMQAAVKAWRPTAQGFAPAGTLWRARFGGRFDRFRDGEIGDVYGDGEPALVVATHDQGVVAVLRDVARKPRVVELDRAPDTWVHEIELGDLDGDGTLEVYATPSAPNRRPGSDGVQAGAVVRYVPATGEGRRVVAALGDRHAKEILVEDVDGDGRDELYAAVEPAPGGRVEVRRWDADTAPEAGALVVSLPDAMCRFLTAGDVDGDGRKEMVLAANASGLWLARPGTDARRPWALTSVDRDSGGFEHAALLADLDGDGRDELYSANDRRRELRRTVWTHGVPRGETIAVHPTARPILTWGIAAAPLSALRPPAAR